jgi:hypothetical protein
MTNRIWILGAPDHEMAAIEHLLRECGETVVHATVDGQRVHPGNAYQADTLPTEMLWSGLPSARPEMTYEVECHQRHPDETCLITHIDHHRPGDPGYGKPPKDFLAASSLGQVIAALGQVADYPSAWRRGAVSRHPHWCGAIERCGDQYVVRTSSVDGDPGYDDDAAATAAVIPLALVLTAAADHCLGAAYAGECPGVDPAELMRFRTQQRAEFQRRDVADVLRDIEETTAALLAAPNVELSSRLCPWHEQGRNANDDCVNSRGTEYANEPCAAIAVRDMRREPPYPELVEAATRVGEGYISGPLAQPDGRRKITCSGSAEQIDAFLHVWSPANSIVDTYGDRARGFAGGYLP